MSATGTLLAQQATQLTVNAASKSPRLAAVNNRPLTPAIASLFAGLGAASGVGSIAAKQAAFAALGSSLGDG